MITESRINRIKITYPSTSKDRLEVLEHLENKYGAANGYRIKVTAQV